MIGLTKVTALEIAQQGITANAICPGYVYTPLVENPFFANTTKYVIFPGLALTGLVMWQWPLFRGLFRRKD